MESYFNTYWGFGQVSCIENTLGSLKVKCSPSAIKNHKSSGWDIVCNKVYTQVTDQILVLSYLWQMYQLTGGSRETSYPWMHWSSAMKDISFVEVTHQVVNQLLCKSGTLMPWLMLQPSLHTKVYVICHSMFTLKVIQVCVCALVFDIFDNFQCYVKFRHGSSDYLFIAWSQRMGLQYITCLETNASGSTIITGSHALLTLLLSEIRICCTS